VIPSSPPARSEQYLANENSETSHSRWRAKRKKISSTGKLQAGEVDPGTRRRR
jgi:hypothetical protein